MKVLHIVRQFAPAIGGLENFVQCLVSEQRQHGIDAEVLTLNRIFHQDQQQRLPATATVATIPVRRIGYWGSYKYPIAPSVLKHLQSFDLIHVHGVDFFCDFLALTKLWHRKPLLLSTHGGFFHTPFASTTKRVFFNSVTRASLKAYVAIYACSNNDFERFAPLCRQRLSLIENGVDTAKFADVANHSPAPSMVFIGRFSNNKRIDKLLHTLAQLRQQLPQATLTIIGKDWDNNLVKLQRLAEQLALGDSLTICTGLTDAQIKAELRRHSYIVSASEYEGFGMTLIEGMAAGLLPLASAIPSFTRIIEQAQVGRLIEFDQPQQAAEQIAEFHQQLHQHHAAWRAQTIAAAQRYAWPAVAKQFSQHYQQLWHRQRTIQGVNVSGSDGAAIIAKLDQAIANQQPLAMAYANAHTINLARQDGHYQQLLNRLLVLNDGVGLDLASRWKYGQGFLENLNGTDFTPRFLSQSQQPLKIFLLGAKADVVAGCAATWRTQFPQHQWVGYHHGYFDDDQAICQQIRASGANLLIVAMGNPKQEQWLDQHLTASGATVGIGVGALFDFVAGTVPRAPNWVRQLRCEWLYRLLQEPKRLWRRYLIGNLTFLYNAIGDNS
ncbi:WecB/TagA/CpsF family glycosyltransferase [Ferrimonas senticii]|uniref:WecB/TagA/CpsF family glycosyltransferase n=1 Tax=Ferrimonas senticii TaxID=394566 RepID=UPI00041A57DF|nr:WecB/TagA/CpsF family glycosyltransferase [Ferrimonas senticii]